METFILPYAITYLLLSTTDSTMLQFNEPIDFVKAGKAGEIATQASADRKTIILTPLVNNGFEQRNIVILTKSNSYNFNYKFVDKGHHQFLKINSGKEDHSLVLKIENDRFKILEGKTSTLVINKRPGSDLYINETVIKNKTYLSKGFPIYEGSIQVVK